MDRQLTFFFFPGILCKRWWLHESTDGYIVQSTFTSQWYAEAENLSTASLSSSNTVKKTQVSFHFVSRTSVVAGLQYHLLPGVQSSRVSGVNNANNSRVQTENSIYDKATRCTANWAN